MYTGFKPNTSVNKSITSVDPTETQLETLQREVDNYTRKLEQQKRKFFSIQDHLKNVTEEYQKEKSKLNELKRENSKAHNVMLQAKVKNLQANLDKAISSYNDTVAHNNRLKNDIDMLRREKKNFTEMLSSLEEQIKKNEAESQQKLVLIQNKKRRAEELKEQIVRIKEKNEMERDQYIKQFDTLEKDYVNDKRDRETLKYQKNSKPEAIDTQPLLKHRLKKIVNSNKEKLKIIEQYKRHMKLIEEAFNDIKEKSGINTLEQITNTFIKSEEQNYSLYNYLDELNQNIDKLQEENRDLQRKIQESKAENIHKQQMLREMDKEEKNRLQLEHYLKKKEESARSLQELVDKIAPVLSTTLLELSRSKFNDDKKKHDYQLGININDRNIEQYLSDLERYVNLLLTIRQETKIKAVHSLKGQSTSYSKPLPTLNFEEINREKAELREDNKFIDENRLREYANEYWEKKKNKIKDL